MPKTKIGKWSVGLLIAFIVFLVIGNIIVASGQEGGDTIFDNLYISIPMILAALCAIAALITGLVSIIKNKERSVLVIIATLIGLIITWFVFGELLIPH